LVTALPQIVCGQCAPCRRGDYHICDALKVEGFQAPGCAQDFFVTSAERIVPLPASFTPEQGALVEPLAVAVHAVSRAGEVRGRNIVVLGAGPIGNLVAQTAQAAGAKPLLADLSDYRLEVAGRCGLAARFNAQKETLEAAARRVFGAEGFQAAIECVGSEATIGAAISAIGKGGTIVVVGVFGEKPRVDLGLVQDRELTVRGTLMYRKEDYQRAVALIAGGQVATAPLDSRHFPFAQYGEAYAFIQRQGDKCVKVFVDLD
jgi:L-iditol 2-dehydrogenase